MIIHSYVYYLYATLICCSTNYSKMCVCYFEYCHYKVAYWCEVCLLEANTKLRCGSRVCRSTRTKLWTLHHLLSKPSTAASPSLSSSRGITRSWMAATQQREKAKDSLICSNLDVFYASSPQARIKLICPESPLQLNYSIQTQLGASDKTKPFLGGR